jgi:hypothetical protein
MLRLSVFRSLGVQNNLVYSLRPGLSRRLYLACGNLLLGYAAGLVGTGINQRLGAVLELPGATGCHDHVAKIAVKSMFWRHFASNPKFVAGLSGARGVHIEQAE